jgi:hypothetical protein
MNDGQIPPLPPVDWSQLDAAMTELFMQLGAPPRWDSFVDAFYPRYSAWFDKSHETFVVESLPPPSVQEP